MLSDDLIWLLKKALKKLHKAKWIITMIFIHLNLNLQRKSVIQHLYAQCAKYRLGTFFCFTCLIRTWLSVLWLSLVGFCKHPKHNGHKTFLLSNYISNWDFSHHFSSKDCKNVVTTKVHKNLNAALGIFRPHHVKVSSLVLFKSQNFTAMSKVVLEGCVSWPLCCYCNNPAISSRNLLERL